MRCSKPVGAARVGKQFWIVAEHGMKTGYVRNLVRHPRVRVKLRKGLGAQWHAGTAHVLSDDDPRERQRWLAGQLPSSKSNAAAVRLFGTELLRCGLIWMTRPPHWSAAARPVLFPSV
jgi:hypothetical protein